MFLRMHRFVCGLAVVLVFWSTGSAGAFGAESSTNAGQLEAAGAPASPIPGLKLERVPETWLTFGLDRIALLRQEVLGNPLWQYLAFLIYIVIAFYVSKLLDYVIQVQLRRWAAKTQTRLDDLLLDLLRGPVKIIAFVVFLHIGLRLFAWPDWAATFISNGLKIVVACSLTYVAIKFVDLLMGIWQQRAEASQEGVLDMQLFPIMRKTLKIFVGVVAVW